MPNMINQMQGAYPPNQLAPQTPPVDPQARAPRPAAPAQGIDPNAQQNAEPDEATYKGWQGFFDKLSSDTDLQQAMIQMGAQMMQPLKPGETQGGLISGAVAGGVGQYNDMQKQNTATALNTRQAETGMRKDEAQIGQIEAQTEGITAGTAQTGVQTQLLEGQRDQQAEGFKREGDANRAKIALMREQAITSREQGNSMVVDSHTKQIEALASGALKHAQAKLYEWRASPAGSAGGASGANKALIETTAEDYMAMGWYDDLATARNAATYVLQGLSKQDPPEVLLEKMKADMSFDYLADHKKGETEARLRSVVESTPSVVNPPGRKSDAELAAREGVEGSKYTISGITIPPEARAEFDEQVAAAVATGNYTEQEAREALAQQLR